MKYCFSTKSFFFLFIAQQLFTSISGKWIFVFDESAGCCCCFFCSLLIFIQQTFLLFAPSASKPIRHFPCSFLFIGFSRSINKRLLLNCNHFGNRHDEFADGCSALCRFMRRQSHQRVSIKKAFSFWLYNFYTKINGRRRWFSASFICSIISGGEGPAAPLGGTVEFNKKKMCSEIFDHLLFGLLGLPLLPQPTCKMDKKTCRRQELDEQNTDWRSAKLFSRWLGNGVLWVCVCVSK